MRSKSLQLEILRCNEDTFKDDNSGRKCASPSEIDDFIKDMTVDIWQEHEKMDVKDFEGEPMMHLESLLASSLLGVNFLPVKQIQILPHFVELNDDFI